MGKCTCRTRPADVKCVSLLQVLSDLQNGGIAWWLDPTASVEGMRTIRQRVFVGMPALYAWLNIVLAALPNTMLGVDTEGAASMSQ